jgi:FtsP/CotA-like multicopper oxidase with cupredoxin domain
MRTLLVAALCLLPSLVLAQRSVPCPRFEAGSVLTPPPDLYSVHGRLELTLTYESRLDNDGNTLYCFTTAAGEQSPTLHVHPGDELLIHLKNDLPPGAAMTMANMPEMSMSPPAAMCGTSPMTTNSVNLHYHGTNVPAACHQDEVIKTAVDGGKSFDYDLHFPKDEPPGLYWYHPHIHGISEPAVLGGASGAIVVEGLENVNRAVAGLPQQILIVRDNLVPGNPALGGNVPAWDVSVNYTPVPYPDFTPAILRMRPEERQLWRVVNASADTILDLELAFDGVPQILEIVGLDGVPTGSQDGLSRGHAIERKHILLPPAGRAEFIVTGPSYAVGTAVLMTRNIDTGPDGDNDPQRPLVRIETTPNAIHPTRMPVSAGIASSAGRFANLEKCTPTAHRKLYFSEVLSDPDDPNSPTNFYLTVDGQTPVLFNPDNPPAIETTQGAVEDWTIENRALENHEFHIHQIHFLVQAQNGVRVEKGQYLDTIQVPYWSGSGPYPSVKLRMDFRGDTVGDFVYHCHILGHEDAGMMAIIRVHARERP